MPQFLWSSRGRGPHYASLDIPIPWLVTALLPLALGPFFGFRFRLWHYLAYMTLVAMELGYYLRWQVTAMDSLPV